MNRMLLAAAALVGALALAAPLAAAKPTHPTHPDHPDQAGDAAAQQCRVLRKADKAAFRSLYGKGAMSRCIKAQKQVAKAELKNAAKECKAERAADPDGFQATYGTGKNGRNALGKCVSAKVRS